MANKKITDLTLYTAAQVQPNDLLFITDMGLYETKRITADDIATYVGSNFSSGSFTGNLSGTASYALTSNSSSYALSSSYSKNSSDSLSASVAQTSISSSYSKTSSFSLTASYAYTAQNVLNVTNVTSVTNADTASYASGSHIFALSSSYAGTASYAISSSYEVSGSYSETAVSSSYAKTASYALNSTAGSMVGTIIAYPSSIVPSGWLACNGAVYSEITYPSLAVVIGKSFAPLFSASVVVQDDNGSSTYPNTGTGTGYIQITLYGGSGFYSITDGSTITNIVGSGNGHTYTGITVNAGSPVTKAYTIKDIGINPIQSYAVSYVVSEGYPASIHNTTNLLNAGAYVTPNLSPSNIYISASQHVGYVGYIIKAS